jgi:SpoVK/Ycf46/Vps4 family AAA+-type ATPase
MMVGPPGCGKTMMARVAAAEVSRRSGKKCRFAVIKPSEWESPYVGETQANIRQCFETLRAAADESGYTVVFMDEIECVTRIRGSLMGHHSDKFLAAFLAEAEGFRDRGNIAIITATNRKDLIAPEAYERLAEVEIHVTRPDMRGAQEIFAIHLDTSFPYSPNGKAALVTRAELIGRAVSRLFDPNADNQLCTVKLRDGKQRKVAAREVVSGRLIEQICRAARQSAMLRHLATGAGGICADDLDEALAAAIARLTTTLTPHNIRSYLSDLPQDIDVVAVEPVSRRVARAHRYLHLQESNGNGN